MPFECNLQRYIEAQLKKEREAARLHEAAAVAAAVEVEKAKAANAVMMLKSQITNVSFQNKSDKLHAKIEEKDSALDERAIQEIRTQQKTGAMKTEKLDTSFLLWAVESQEVESFWALNMCVVGSIRKPRSCVFADPLFPHPGLVFLPKGFQRISWLMYVLRCVN